MSFSSVEFVRKPLTIGQIQQQFTKHKDVEGEVLQATLMSLYHQLLAEGFNAEGNDEHDLVMALEMAKNPITAETYVQTISLSQGSPEQNLTIAKLLLLGHGSKSAVVLQVLSELSGNKIPVDFPLLTKEKQEEWEANKKVLITYLYTHGSAGDKEFLRTHFLHDHSYFQMLEEMVVTGGTWVSGALQTVMAVPTNLTDIYNAWRMSRNLQADSLEKANYKALNDLAAASHSEKFKRFQGPSIEEISDAEFDEPESVKAKEKIGAPKVEVTSDASKGKEKSDASKQPRAWFNPGNWFSFGMPKSQIDALAVSQKLGHSVLYDNEKEKEEGENLNASLNDSFVMLAQPELPQDLLELHENLSKLATDVKTGSLGTYDANNLHILLANCRRLYDAKNNDYYTTEEVNKIVTADKLHKEKSGRTEDLKPMIEGAKAKLRHQRHLKEVARLNDPIEGQDPFSALCIMHHGDRETTAKVKEIQETWRRRSAYATLSSPSIMQLTENVESLTLYLHQAQEEIKNDHTLNQGAWLETVDTLRKLEVMIAKTQAEIINAMLERLKLVPRQELLHVDLYDDTSKTYFDDLMFDTFNSLIPYGLSEKFVMEFAQQTNPSCTLSRDIIKQFRRYIQTHGTPEQKEDYETIAGESRTEKTSLNDVLDDFVVIQKKEIAGVRELRVPKPKGLIVPKASEESGQVQELSSSLGRSSGWWDMKEKLALHFHDAEVEEREATEIGNFYQLIPGDVPEIEEEYEYVFTAIEEQEAAAHAERYFSDHVNKKFFIERFKFYRLAAEDVLPAMELAFKDASKFLIERDLDLFPQNPHNLVSADRKKNRFRELAEKLSAHLFCQESPDLPFEKCVLDAAFNAVVSIEKAANQFYGELKKIWPIEVVNKFDTLFLETAYVYLLENPRDIEGAIQRGHQTLLIATHAETIDEEYRDVFTSVANNCLGKSKVEGQAEDRDQLESRAILIAKKSVNLLNVLAKEKQRVQDKKFGMSKDITGEKDNDFIAKMDAVKHIASQESLKAFEVSLVAEESVLCKRRGWFSFFPCIKSDTEKNLRKFIDGEAPERNVIAIK